MLCSVDPYSFRANFTISILVGFHAKKDYYCRSCFMLFVLIMDRSLWSMWSIITLH